MTYQQAPQPTPVGRPVTVTAAAACQLASVFFSLVSVAISAVSLSKMTEALAGSSAAVASSVNSTVKIASIGTIAFYLLLGIGTVILALFNLRGRNAARIVSWVLSGLFVLCGVCGLVSNGVNAGNSTVQSIYDKIGSWYQPSVLAVTLLLVLANVGAIILLALRPSSEFFKASSQPAGVDPGYPNPPYPSV